MGYSPCGHKESDTTGWLTLSHTKLSQTPPVFSSAPLPSSGLGCPNPAPSVLPFPEVEQQSQKGYRICLCKEWQEMVLGSICFLNQLATSSPLLNATLLSLTDQVPCSRLSHRNNPKFGCFANFPTSDLVFTSNVSASNCRSAFTFCCCCFLSLLFMHFCFKKKSHMSFWILPDSNQLRSPDRRKKKP